MHFTAGVLSRDGNPDHETILERLALGRPVVHVKPMSVVSVDPEDVGSGGLGGPYRRDGYVISWIGRLDNLADCVGLGEARPRDVEEAVLACYVRWGTAGFIHLIGDFAFSLWDPIQRRLILAVDAPGRLPLYYHLSPFCVVWATSASLVASALSTGFELSDDYVADFLTNRPSVESPFRGVMRVPPGSAVVVEPGRAKVQTYWTPDPAHEIRYCREEEYEEHFLSVFREAVACRLGNAGPVACELSGGLDSSSLVCTADRILDRRTAHKGLILISYVFGQSLTSDESDFINSVASRLRWPSLVFDENDCLVLTPPAAELACEEPTSQLLFLSRQDRVAQAMKERGATILLNGIGGDQMFWSEPPPGLPLTDLLWEHKLFMLHRSCCEWARVLGWSYPRTLWKGAIWPLLPRRWRARWQRTNPVGEWLVPSFVSRAQLADRVLGSVDDVGFARPSQAAQYAMIRQTMRPYALERVTSDGIADVRYPYLDRRLIEFSLALPLDQKVRTTETRSIVRRSFRGLLPETIRTRTTKAGPTEAFLRALTRQRAWVEHLFKEARTVELGYVDAAAMESALKRARHGILPNTVQLMKTLALEIWLRSSVCRPGRVHQDSRHITKGEYHEHGTEGTVRVA
jgi:asparagine synthase (glutamine-hydrolysing)